MCVTVLRGGNRIGENLIEVTDGNTKILLECGVPLTETEEGKAAEEHVLKTRYDAVIITHYHADHSGLLKTPIQTQEIYMGKATQDILLHDRQICGENISKIKVMTNEESFSVGAITVKPYLCDHSAYDSYMVELKTANENLLYTGDFRANGRKSFSALLSRLPESVDVLITEGTNLRRAKRCETERALEEKAAELFKTAGKVFVLQSRLNIDRTVTFYRAAKRTRRIFLQSLSSAEVCSLLENVPNAKKYDDCYTYLSHGVEKEALQRLKSCYGKKLLSKYAVAKRKRAVIQIHAGMLGYLKALAEICDLSDSLLIYSMWEGYKAELREFLEGVSSLGIKTLSLHTSGHAGLAAIEVLERRVNPKKEIIVHCDNSEYQS